MIDIEKERKAFEAWFKSLNENGRTTYFLGQESKVAWEAWQVAIAIRSEKCVWRENEDGIWDTECGQDYVFDGYAGQKPSDCGQYCSNCGKKIEDVSFEESEDE